MKLFLITILSAFIGLSQNSYASEKSLYNFKWLDKDEEVYVIQNKEFTKKGRIAVDIGVAQSENSPYYDSLGFFTVGTYHFNENFSIDFTYKKYANSESQDLKNLLKLNDTQTKPLLNLVDDAILINANWIPFYGKLNVFNQIYYFDMGIGFGIGKFSTQSNYKTFQLKNIPLTLEKGSSNGLNSKIYFKFFTNNKMTFGFAYNISALQAIKSTQGTKENFYYTDFLLNIGYLF